MDKSNLLKRGAEILAGLIIVVTALAYTSVGIRIARQDASQIMSDNGANLSDNEHDSLVAEDVADFSSGDTSLDIYESNVHVLSDPALSASSISEQDEPLENTAIQSIGNDIPEQEQETVSDTAPPVYKFVNVNLLNVRKGPSSETDKITALPKAARVQCFESDGEWVKITTDDKVEGYVFAEYLSDTAPPVYKYVIVNALNLRKGPGSDTEILGTIPYGNKVQVFEASNEYIRVVTNNGVEGYVWKEYLADETVLASRSSSAGLSYNADLASKIIEYAKQFLGVKYVYGGSTPNGFDCSGFTQYVFKKFNIKVPRSAHEYANVGTKVSRENLKPGDILLFDRNDDYRLGHVGIYIGNDKFIHASSSKGKVVIATLSKYGENLLGIRRVIK